MKADTGFHQCDNCEQVFHAAELKSILNLEQRVDPGGVVPSGECPECGVLCYPVDAEASVEEVLSVQLELVVHTAAQGREEGVVTLSWEEKCQYAREQIRDHLALCLDDDEVLRAVLDEISVVHRRLI